MFFGLGEIRLRMVGLGEERGPFFCSLLRQLTGANQETGFYRSWCLVLDILLGIKKGLEGQLL